MGGVDVSEQLFGDPSRSYLTVRVASVEHGLHPFEPVLGEFLVAGEQDAADPLQRVALAPSMPERVVLDSAADVIDLPVGQPDGMEVVHHQGDVGEPVLECSPIAGGRVQRRQPDLGTPVVATVLEPAVQHVPGAARDHVEEPVPVQVNV